MPRPIAAVRPLHSGLRPHGPSSPDEDSLSPQLKPANERKLSNSRRRSLPPPSFPFRREDEAKNDENVEKEPKGVEIGKKGNGGVKLKDERRRKFGSRRPSSVAANAVARRRFSLPGELRIGDSVLVNSYSYKLLREIGNGGSSTVYEAKSSRFEETVALKVVDVSAADDELKNTLSNEIRFLRELHNCSYVVRMHDSQILPDRLYVIMELGEANLRDHIERRRDVGRADPMAWRWIFAEMLQCVRAVHSHGIVHADLKPANFVFVGQMLKLIDFGIAARVKAAKAAAFRLTLQGTLNYMSPEAIGGRSDGKGYELPLKVDVWSLGCILYALITGRPPFADHSTPAAKLRAIAVEPIRLPPEVTDPLLIDVLKKCLERDVQNRPTVEQLLRHPYVASGGGPTGDRTLTAADFKDLMRRLRRVSPRQGARLLKAVVTGRETTEKSN